MRSKQPSVVSEIVNDKIDLWRSVSDSWKKLTREVEKNLARVGIGIPELRILRTLEDSGPTQMARLSLAALLTQPAITVIVDKLEDQGYVERARSKEDRRVINIKITQSGEALLKDALKIHKQFVEKMLEGLSDSELEELALTMNKLALKVS
ncbi:MAG: MarR family winged helix-turn-helix transcriptional regulator [Nitrososphaerales archaeon]